MSQPTAKPRRVKVLVVSHGDGFLEVFGPKHVDVKIERCPAAFSSEAEKVAENVLELSLPPVWQRLYFPGLVRATAMLKPLLPSAIREANTVRELVCALNSVQERAA